MLRSAGLRRFDSQPGSRLLENTRNRHQTRFRNPAPPTPAPAIDRGGSGTRRRDDEWIEPISTRFHRAHKRFLWSMSGFAAGFRVRRHEAAAGASIRAEVEEEKCGYPARGCNLKIPHCFEAGGIKMRFLLLLLSVFPPAHTAARGSRWRGTVRRGGI